MIMTLVRVVVIVLLAIANLCCFSQQQEEFNGPFSGWCNVKERFHTNADGISDDTRAIQDALDSLSQQSIHYNVGKQAYVVIYLPAGTYCISSTLLLKGKTGVSIIGESPLTTIIKWTGPDNDTMLHANGSAYFKISRLTWDANNHTNIEALGIHWTVREKNSKSESSAPTNIEISDNTFTGNCKIGISGGTVQGEGMNAMDSEISIRRCVFNACETGIQIKGYNALDYWIWDCKFIKCSFGVKCNSGNYHIYRSYFSNCYNDTENTNSYYTSLRGCYSEGSTHFSYDQGASQNPFKRIFQGNTVIAPKEIPIISYHLGKITLLDNFFDSASSKTVKAFVETGSLANGNSEVLSISNKFRNTKSVQFNKTPFTLFSYNDNLGIAIKKENAFTTSMETLPPAIKRRIFTVPPGADDKKIQELIEQAVKLNGSKPIVYFPFGKYVLNTPLIISANSDVQLIGDGYIYASVLLPSAGFPKGKALVIVQGPSNIVIRDIMLNQFTDAMDGINGIAFTGVDQPGSHAFIEQLYTNAKRSLYGNGLDYLAIQECNSFFSYGKYITGGPLVQNGKGTAGLYCFGGQYAGVSTDKNAVAVMKDCWWEGAAKKPLDFSGSGRITIDGAMVAPNKADSTTTISINKFAGKISLLNMYVQGGIGIESNNPRLSVMLWNIHFYFELNPLKTVTAAANYQAGFAGLTTQCFIAGDKTCDNIFTVQDVFKGNVKKELFFPDMLADDRLAVPQKYTLAPAGASNIYISRVSVGDCNTTISFAK